MASAAARLLRAYATQVEALRRLRHGGSQTLRVEHVHVNEGGQAVIKKVRSGKAVRMCQHPGESLSGTKYRRADLSVATQTG